MCLTGCCMLPSAVCDIGSASFKYDMRRLSEILAFPRAWYRRSIARRLFLGDQTINLPGDSSTTLWLFCWLLSFFSSTQIYPAALWLLSWLSLGLKEKKPKQIIILYFHLSTFSLPQPLAPPPLTQQKMSPSICPQSPAGKPTGGPGTAALEHSTCPSPPMSSQSTPLEAICPRAAWATSSLLHPDVPGACLIPLLQGEVITNTTVATLSQNERELITLWVTANVAIWTQLIYVINGSLYSREGWA